MRMLDVGTEASVRNLQMYLTLAEAVTLSKHLARLMKDPEAHRHAHVVADDGQRELSLSLVTQKKLQDLSGYTLVEQHLLQED